MDYAGVLLPGDVNRLQSAAGSLAPRIETDLFVVTVDDRDPRWVAMGAHRAMVERAFSDLETARARHYGANQKLTVLVAFKSSVVLHLYTNLKTLEQTLLLNNFYGGLRTTELKIRRPGETHADAVMRYLGAFNASAVSGLPSQIRGPVLGYIDRYALLLSRELWETSDAVPAIGPAYAQGLLRASTIFTSNVVLPGYVSFLLLCIALHLLIGMVLFVLITVGLKPFEWILQARSPSAYAFVEATSTEWLEWFLGLLFLSPVLALLFTVANYDVENMLYLHQVFGTDLVQHLDWARAIWAVSPNIGWPVIFSAAFVVAALEWLKYRRAHPSRSVFQWVLFVWTLIPKLILTISTGVFTGLVAGYFILSIVAFQLWGIFKPNHEASSLKAGTLQAAGSERR